jgi:phosphatidylglycerophosphate synthase
MNRSPPGTVKQKTACPHQEERMTLLARREMTLQPHPAVLGALAQSTLVLGLAATVGLGAAGWVTGVAFGALVWPGLGHGMRRFAVRSWGPADTVTLVRLAVTGGVAALVADAFVDGTSRPVLVALAAVAAILDAVDGQVARRTRTTSTFGARFDMEADSVLVLVLSIFAASLLGWWVAAIGLFRYAFVAAARAWPWLSASLPPRMVRKSIAALQGAILVVASADLLPLALAQAGVAVALGFLTWSFGTDISWLRSKHRLESAHR